MEQAGMLSNSLYAFRLTQRDEYARMANEIIGYLNDKLFDARTAAYFGCEDFLRHEGRKGSADGEFFSVIDRCIYADANAMAAIALLEAHRLIGREDCKERALNLLEFLWSRCRAEAAICHYYDSAPRLAGMLLDQAQAGTAMLQAYRASGDARYLERASDLAEFLLLRLKNPRGGFYDREPQGLGFLKLPLTDIDQNGAAASFLLTLHRETGATHFRDAALWALRAGAGEPVCDGLHSARLGRALCEYLR